MDLLRLDIGGIQKKYLAALEKFMTRRIPVMRAVGDGVAIGTEEDG